MKRTELKRKTPMSRGTSELKRTLFKQSSELKRTGGLKQKSARQKEREARYKLLRDDYMEKHPICEFEGCNESSTELPHKAGRIGENMFRWFMADCSKHHAHIHSHTTEARELGYLITDDPRREGDL